MGSSRQADRQSESEEGGLLRPTSQELDHTYVPGLVVLYDQEVLHAK